jgi:Ca2+-transporting ATPase
MSTRVRMPGADNKYRIYTKGAAEMVLKLCNRRLKPDGTTEPIIDVTNELRVIQGFAREALRTICLAYKVLPLTLYPLPLSV